MPRTLQPIECALFIREDNRNDTMCSISREDSGLTDEIQRVRDKAKSRTLKQLGYRTLRQNSLRNDWHPGHGAGNWGKTRADIEYFFDAHRCDEPFQVRTINAKETIFHPSKAEHNGSSASCARSASTA